MNALMKKLPVKVVRTISKTGLTLRKYSPELLIGMGIVGFCGTAVLAVRSSKKHDEIISGYDEIINDIRNSKDDYDDPKEYQHDLTFEYGHKALAVAKIWAPTVTCGAASTAMILGGTGIMKKRYTCVLAAYKLAESSFKEYRRRVVEELGPDMDLYFKDGIRREKVKVEEIDEKGKKTKVTKEVTVVDPNMPSQYARFFDESSRRWKPNSEYNLLFLRGVQNEMNDHLKIQGHLFLNEVYDALDIPRTKEGAVVGWVIGEAGDNYVDFGIWNSSKAKSRDFVNGFEEVILLDFNVDGVIWDKI